VRLRLATRRSKLALAQASAVARNVEAATPGVTVELVPTITTGDRTVGPLADAGGKGLFVKEVELALLDRRADFAVHSMKDVPVTMPLVDQAELVVAAVPERADARDVLVTRNNAADLAALPPGATVGTSSPRRAALVRDLRPDLVVLPLRGNVDTRLAALDAGQFDAILLAAAGLARLGISRFTPLDPTRFVPAAGQGALAVQCRADDAATVEVLAKLNDAAVRRDVSAERQVVDELDGDCHSAIGASVLDGVLHTFFERDGRYVREQSPLG
jgi:hydroxymethylbilane synthase